MNQDPVIVDFLACISSVRAQIQRLILFGLRARGSHLLDSDYNLLLVVAKKESCLLDALYEGSWTCC